MRTSRNGSIRDLNVLFERRIVILAGMSSFNFLKVELTVIWLTGRQIRRVRDFRSKLTNKIDCVVQIRLQLISLSSENYDRNREAQKYGIVDRLLARRGLRILKGFVDLSEEFFGLLIQQRSLFAQLLLGKVGL